MYKKLTISSFYNFKFCFVFISSIISMIPRLPLAEVESKPLTVMSSKVPCRKGIPITLIIADCSNSVLMKYNNGPHLTIA